MKLLKLVKKHKIISIYIILSTILILCMIVLVTLTAITHEKDKKYRTFFERDNTTIVCNKGEKIGKMKIRYKTKDNKNLQKYAIKLYCTNNPIVEGSYPDKLYSIALGGFFNKFEKKMNLYSFNIDTWNSDVYSKEWDRKYPDDYFIN